MKNQITILLLTVHLFAYTDFLQIVKFPQVLKHYQSHIFLNKSLSFGDFLAMHYGNYDNKGNTQDKEDMKLPFKTINIHIVVSAVISSIFSIKNEFEIPTFHKYFFCYHYMIISSSPSAGIFRPPIITA
jgi:hypothetical protein